MGGWSSIRALRVRLRENPEPFRILFSFPFVGDEQRERLLDDLRLWEARKSFAAEVRSAEDTAKGFARALLEHPPISEALKSTPHLGSLARLSRIPATRHDYVLMVCSSLLEIKKRYPGLGLGSTTLGPGFQQKPLSGLEVAQSLVVLLNWGHLFGTFATERGVLYHIESERDFENLLAQQLPENLRDWARAELRERSIHRFHYVLAARKACKKLTEPLRGSALACFATWALEDEKARPIRWAIRRARQLAYHRMHSLLDLGYSFAPATYERLLDQLRESQQIGFDDSTTTVERTMDALDRLQSEVIFASPEAAASELGHLRQLHDWWMAKTEISLCTRIDALAQQPADWPKTATTADFTHFCRLRLPSDSLSWPALVRAWRGQANTWNGSSFLITPGPQSKLGQDVLIDLFMGARPAKETVAHIVGRLAERTHSTWHDSPDDRTRQIWRAVAHFGINLLQLHLQDGLSAVLTPVMGAAGHEALALAARGPEPACSRIRELAATLDNSTRQCELYSLADLIEFEAPVGHDELWLAFLGMLRLVNKNSGNHAREIDCAWLRCSPSAMVWTLAETKDGKQGGRVAQLEHLRNDLNLQSGDIRTCKLRNGTRVALAEFRF
jgi:hypothetical protein